jgi:hypothetical protein
MSSELRLTDTNAASDSQGRTWGLEGNLFWWLVGGVGAGITLFFLLLVGIKLQLLTSFGVAVVPVILCLVYIFGLRQGKPPGYDRDFLERQLSNPGLSPEQSPSHQPRHPLSEF